MCVKHSEITNTQYLILDLALFGECSESASLVRSTFSNHFVVFLVYKPTKLACDQACLACWTPALVEVSYRLGSVFHPSVHPFIHLQCKIYEMTQQLDSQSEEAPFWKKSSNR